MSGTVRFLLDGAVHEVADPDPTLTVLTYLRYHLRRTGTKEGCAEGDCGACTVVVGERIGGALTWRAVNACIVFLPMLDGRALVTVESLSGVDGGLHPVQQAMADHHGSQCGFCTPGFVMSLYAHYVNGGALDDAAINDTLAGNLCRCTGYGPIMTAARLMHDYPRPPDALASADALDAIRRDRMLSLSYVCPLTGITKRYFAPRTVAELAQTLDCHPDAVLLAGATDVGLWVTKQHRVLETVISINDVADLRAIVETDTAVEIGAGARYTDAHDLLARLYPDFGELIRRLGSVQIRNSGTIGGNIANGSPIGDSMPALIAAGATLVLRSADGTRTLPLEDYFIDYGRQDRCPGEFVEKVVLPKPEQGRIFRAYKLSKRFDQDISGVCGAFAITLDGQVVTAARVCFGGMAATPRRARACEAALEGRPWTVATVRRAMAALADDYTPIDDMRASAGYRMAAARNLLLKACIESCEPEQATRLVGEGVAVHA